MQLYIPQILMINAFLMNMLCLFIMLFYTFITIFNKCAQNVNTIESITKLIKYIIISAPFLCTCSIEGPVNWLLFCNAARGIG